MGLVEGVARHNSRKNMSRPLQLSILRSCREALWTLHCNLALRDSLTAQAHLRHSRALFLWKEGELVLGERQEVLIRPWPCQQVRAERLTGVAAKVLNT